MTMGDRIPPTRPRRLDPPESDEPGTTAPAVGTAPSLPSQPEPRPIGDPASAPRT